MNALATTPARHHAINPNPELATLAAELNREHAACFHAAHDAYKHALRVGELLSAAKGLCKHGEFTSWLQSNFKGSVRTGQQYMEIWANRAQIEARSADSALLTISGAAKLIGAPKAPKNGREKVTPVMRREARAAFGFLVRFVDELGEFHDMTEAKSILTAIAEGMSGHW